MGSDVKSFNVFTTARSTVLGTARQNGDATITVRLASLPIPFSGRLLLVEAVDPAAVYVAKKITTPVHKALEIAREYGQIDGGHHKAWVIDQIIRTLTGEHYDEWVRDACDGDDGPNTYAWETGTPP